MKIVHNIILVLLILLAVASGVPKLLLMPREVEFFSAFGFTDPLLIIFGALQLLGAMLMTLPRYRVWGVVIVAATFLVSLAALISSKQWPMVFITLIVVALLGLVGRQARQNARATSNSIND